MIDLLINMQKLIIHGQVADNSSMKSILSNFSNNLKDLNHGNEAIKQEKQLTKVLPTSY